MKMEKEENESRESDREGLVDILTLDKKVKSLIINNYGEPIKKEKIEKYNTDNKIFPFLYVIRGVSLQKIMPVLEPVETHYEIWGFQNNKYYLIREICDRETALAE